MRLVEQRTEYNAEVKASPRKGEILTALGNERI